MPPNAVRTFHFYLWNFRTCASVHGDRSRDVSIQLVSGWRSLHCRSRCRVSLSPSTIMILLVTIIIILQNIHRREISFAGSTGFSVSCSDQATHNKTARVSKASGNHTEIIHKISQFTADHFTGPVRVLSLMCVCVCVCVFMCAGNNFRTEMTFDVYIRRAWSRRPYLGHVWRSRSYAEWPDEQVWSATWRRWTRATHHLTHAHRQSDTIVTNQVDNTCDGRRPWWKFFHLQSLARVSDFAGMDTMIVDGYRRALCAKVGSVTLSECLLVVCFDQLNFNVLEKRFIP